MTSDEFRQLALALPEATEGSHMSHADFRVKGKIFATLPGLDEDLGELGMVTLTAEQQADLVARWPKVFEPCHGAWGKEGATYIRLEQARAGVVRKALRAAWRDKAPEDLTERSSSGS
jgi:hypothetical protein